MPGISRRDCCPYGGMTVLIVVALCLMGCGSPLRSSLAHPTAVPSSTSLAPHHWLLAASGAMLLEGTAVGMQFLHAIDTPATYEIIHSAQSTDPLPQATHVESFQSYQAMQAAFAKGTILPQVKVILYDNEHWQGTPATEQQNPFRYVPLAEQLVHQHGLQFMNTPAADLSQVLTPLAPDQYQGYTQAHLATLAADADIFEIQAQNAPTVADYLTFAKQAIEQARMANPQAMLLLGITAKTNGPTAQQLLQEVQGTHASVDGYWLNILGGAVGPATALALIQLLG
jgi:hypothetical protein